MIVRAPLAYVRLAGGGTVALYEGAAVPAGADDVHVGQLAAKGVLGDWETPASDSIEDILRFVGSNQSRAVEYLDLELDKAKDEQRSTLVKKLKAIAGPGEA